MKKNLLEGEQAGRLPEEGVKEKISVDGPLIKELWGEMHHGGFMKLFPMCFVIKTLSSIPLYYSLVGLL